MDEAEEQPGDSLADLLAIFEIADKGALQAHVAKMVLDGGDLASLILACDAESIPIGHVRVHRHFHPPHLDLTDENLQALASNGVGPLSKAAKKTVNKVSATFRERRLFNAHFFWLAEYPREWHLFYFDQRDVAGDHWREGSHIHLMNYCTHPQVDPRPLIMSLLDDMTLPKLSGLHIRYRR